MFAHRALAQVLLQDEEVTVQKLVDNEENLGIAVPFNFFRSVRSLDDGEVLFSSTSASGSPSLPATPPLAARPPRPLLPGAQDVLPEAVELPDVLWCGLQRECARTF